MIDVRISPLQFPTRWVRREVVLHVLMQVPLQIDSASAKRTHDNIRTNTRFDRHVAIRIFDLLIRSIVAGRLSDLLDRAVYDELEVR